MHKPPTVEPKAIPIAAPVVKLFLFSCSGGDDLPLHPCVQAGCRVLLRFLCGLLGGGGMYGGGGGGGGAGLLEKELPPILLSEIVLIRKDERKNLYRVKILFNSLKIRNQIELLRYPAIKMIICNIAVSKLYQI